MPQKQNDVTNLRTLCFLWLKIKKKTTRAKPSPGAWVRNLFEFCPNSLLNSPIAVFIEAIFRWRWVYVCYSDRSGLFFLRNFFYSDDTGRENVNVGRQKDHLNSNRESTLVYTCWQPKQISINVQLIIRARFFFLFIFPIQMRCDVIFSTFKCCLAICSECVYTEACLKCDCCALHRASLISWTQHSTAQRQADRLNVWHSIVTAALAALIHGRVCAEAEQLTEISYSVVSLLWNPCEA